MSDYTPTTDDVRDAYIGNRWSVDQEFERLTGPEFDRWLAMHDREVLLRLGEKLVESMPCLEHRRCTCRYALVSLGIQLRRENKKEESGV